MAEVKALSLLKSNKSVKERAENYLTFIKRELQREILDQLIIKKEKIESELFELTNFTLDTNINSGLSRMTNEDCKDRFKRIIGAEYELTLIDLELKAKQNTFDKYFNLEEGDFIELK
jgi:hypothetical protein